MIDEQPDFISIIQRSEREQTRGKRLSDKRMGYKDSITLCTQNWLVPTLRFHVRRGFKYSFCEVSVMTVLVWAVPEFNVTNVDY